MKSELVGMGSDPHSLQSLTTHLTLIFKQCSRSSHLWSNRAYPHPLHWLPPSHCRYTVMVLQETNQRNGISSIPSSSHLPFWMLSISSPLQYPLPLNTKYCMANWDVGEPHQANDVSTFYFVCKNHNVAGFYSMVNCVLLGSLGMALYIMKNISYFMDAELLWPQS